jgi:tRNA (cytidine/uridine-2'-O-)-methyltransferase
MFNKNNDIHIVLVEPEIHWNTGNAGRTCLGLDATLHLVKPLGFDIDDKSVKRAGLDYWKDVKLEVWEDWASFEAQMFELGAPFFFSAEGEKRHFEVEYPEKVVLLFGKETAGFDAKLRARYRDRLLCIPMAENSLRSINLSTCVGIASYEVVRQWASRHSL